MKQKTWSTVREYNNSKKMVEEKLNTTQLSIAGKRQAVYVADYLPASMKKLLSAPRVC